MRLLGKWGLVFALLIMVGLSGCQLFKRGSGAPTPTPTFSLRLETSAATEAPVESPYPEANPAYPEEAEGELSTPSGGETPYPLGGSEPTTYPDPNTAGGYNPYPAAGQETEPAAGQETEPAASQEAYPGAETGQPTSTSGPAQPTATAGQTQPTATSGPAQPTATGSALATTPAGTPSAAVTPGGSSAVTPATPTPFVTFTPSATPSPTPTPTPTPVPLTDRMIASDPRTFKLDSGGVQFVEFFAYWCLPCLQMAPVVHGLEDEFEDVIHFVYLDIDNPLNAKFQRELGFKAAPEYYLLDEDGKVLAKWSGLVELEEFQADIQDALR